MVEVALKQPKYIMLHYDAKVHLKWFHYHSTIIICNCTLASLIKHNNNNY